MNQKEINKQRSCSHLLPPPGGEVVRSLLDEIEKLQAKGAGTPCCLVDIEPGKAFIVPEVGQVYIRSDRGSGVAVIQCVRVLPDVEVALLTGRLRVCGIELNIDWKYT
jgi:hypothetical protein